MKILITGSTDGIGLETATQLSSHGHEIWIHGRNKEKVEISILQIKKINSNAKLNSFICDLSDFDSIKEAVIKLKSECSELDVLINNAGVFMNDFEITKYHVEKTMVINHLSHFLLTFLLKELLKNGKNQKIITVSSIAHTRGQLLEKDFALIENFEPYKAYAASKLANVLFARKLAKEWSQDHISSYCLHPGVINTKLLLAGFGAVGNNVNLGAQTSVFLALTSNSNLQNGSYYDNKQERDVAPQAKNLELESSFWKWSKNILGFN